MLGYQTDIISNLRYIPYSRGHTRRAYKYEFGENWGMCLYLNVFSHSVTLNLKLR